MISSSSSDSTESSKRAVVKMAWPIAVSMFSFTLKSFVDTIMVGHLGIDALAGVGLAGIIAWNMISFPFGALRGQRPLVSQYLGAGDRTAALSFGVHAFYFAAFISTLLFLISDQLGALTQWLGESSNISAESTLMAREYLYLRMLWVAPMLLSLAIAEYLRSIGKTRLPMLTDLLAHPLNVLFNYLLIFGKFGLPELGVRGAAIGTGLADLCALFIMFLFARPRGDQRKLWLNLEPLRFRWRRMKDVIETGYTGGFQFSLEGGSFLLITYFVGFLGTASLAIQQAAIQLVHLSILPAIAIADGGSILVGQFVGERRWVEAQNTVKSVLGLILPFMCGMGLIFLIWGDSLMGLFLKESDPILREQILSMGSSVALAIAVWQIGDAFQVTYRHCLRATGDHKWVMWAGISMSWLLNIPIVALTIFWFEGTVFHSWLVFSVEIYFGAWIFHRRWKSGVWREKRLVR